MNLKNLFKLFVITNCIILLFTQCSKDETQTPIITDKRNIFVGTWYASGTLTLQIPFSQPILVATTDTFQFQLSLLDSTKIVDVYNGSNDIYNVNNVNMFTRDSFSVKSTVPILGVNTNVTTTFSNNLGVYNTSNSQITFTSTVVVTQTQGGNTTNGLLNEILIKK